MRKNRVIPFEQRPKYAIVVDGDCEFWYIQMLKRNENSINVNLEPKIPQKKKLSDQFEKAIELSEIYDKVYWIIDFDVINRETRLAKKGSKTALQECKEYFNLIEKEHKSITTIINNPCLEYWFLLHFESTAKYYETCEKVIKQLKKHNSLAKYEKNRDYFTKQNNDIYLKLRPYLCNAIQNAKKLGSFDFNHSRSGMSQMQLIFEIDCLKKVL